MKTLAEAVNAGQYGYTTWTFLPPATNTYLVSGIEEVWLGKITTAQFLEKLDATFKQEQGRRQGSGHSDAPVMRRRNSAWRWRRRHRSSPQNKMYRLYLVPTWRSISSLS